MKIRNLEGRTFIPGMIPDLPTGNLVWVDQVHGNDDLAARERMTLPFKTLAKAKDRANSGDTIMVLPGEYDERNLLKNGVNWHFWEGAYVHYTGTADGALFDDSAGDGAGGQVDCAIAGEGRFRHAGSGANRYVVRTTYIGSNVRFTASRISSSWGFACEAGQQRVRVLHDLESVSGEESIRCSGGSQFVEVGGALSGDIVASGGYLVLRAARLMDVALEFSGGTQHVQAQEGEGVTIVIEDGSLYFQVPRTMGVASDPTLWALGGVVRILNSVILAGEDICSPGYAVVLQGGTVILKDSHAIDKEHNYAISGSGDLLCLGATWSNKPRDPNVTLLNLGFEYDTDIDF